MQRVQTFWSSFTVRPLLAVFVLAHAIILIGGFDTEFWPLLNYSIFSRTDTILERPEFELEAIDRAGHELPWRELDLAPFPHAYAFHSMVSRSKRSDVCAFLQSRLKENVGEFRLTRRAHWGEPWESYLLVTRESSCAD